VHLFAPDSGVGSVTDADLAATRAYGARGPRYALRVMRTRSLLPVLAAVLAACTESAPTSPDAARDAAVAADASVAADATDAALEDIEDVPASCALDGALRPDATAGRCAASLRPSALRRANEMDGDDLVIPGGQRLARATSRLALPGFPLAMIPVPGTRRVIVTEGGLRTNVLRVIDMASGTPVVVTGGTAEFPADETAQEPALWYGLALSSDQRRLYASGGGGNRIYAFTLSPAGALTPDPARTVDLMIPERGNGMVNSPFVAGVALSADDQTLFACFQLQNALSIRDAATGRELRRVEFPASGAMLPLPYTVITRPGDPAHVYVSLWGVRQVAEVDVARGVVERSWDVGKNPQEMLFSEDGRTLYAVATDSDAVTTIDVSTMMGTVARHYLGGDATAPRGISPSAIAWGPPRGTGARRLYVVQAGENAVDVLDGATFARVGRLRTEWYPTDVLVDDDGTVTVLTGKGVGLGPNNNPARVDITALMAGSIARYPAPTDMDLTRGDADARASNEGIAAFSEVSCPAGAAYDFPIPRPGAGASAQIRHVVMIVRENKTYDALLGDFPEGLGNPEFTIVPRARMDRIFPNFRGLTRAYAGGDNFYSLAVQSIQGHIWTVLGRTTDFTERTWTQTWGRGQRQVPPQGTTEAGMPEEGSLFDAMARAGVRMENWGEPVGLARFIVPIQRYGSIPQDQRYPDIRRAQNFINWTVEECRLAPFTYIALPNDHTSGGRAGYPTVESAFQDNDEAVGYIVDRLSHSRYWPETLVVVIEDDPQDGGDRVDNHRSVVLMAGPWVRRGYMSHGHYDNASLHRTVEAIFGIPPHNRTIANAAAMYDFFTSTPDYTPYTYIPRRDPPALNPAGNAFAAQSAAYDWSEVDNQPGLGRLIWRITHDGREPPWQSVREAIDLDGDGD
jgi:DNA-binding beta-propeller fold protein YncE